MLNLSIDPSTISVDANGVATYTLTANDVANALSLANAQLAGVQNTQTEYQQQIEDLGTSASNIQKLITQLTALQSSMTPAANQ